MLASAFKGKRVFLTGHTGFKGSWLTLWLSRLGATVRGYSLEPPSDPYMFSLIGLDDVCESVCGDIRDLETLVDSMRGFAPDIVIHMAAQPLVRRSYAEPVETFSVNVLGTVNVLEAVRRTKAQVVLNITSDKCYKNLGDGLAFKESSSMGGADPYSASKGCAELVAESWERSFFQDGPLLASVRAGNVIGGGDFGEDRLLPDMVRAFSKGDSVHIRSPKAVRPWQFVLDPLSGYLALARQLLAGNTGFVGGWNFGPSGQDTRTVGEVAAAFADRWGSGASIESDAGNHLYEAAVLRLDCNKASTELGWTSRMDIKTALDWSVEWYNAWADGRGGLRDMVEKQIGCFEKLR